MKPLSETYKELRIEFTFPIEIRNSNGRRTYYEGSDRHWFRREYDFNGNKTYSENSQGFWQKQEYDSDGKQTYYENSYGDKEGTPTSI